MTNEDKALVERLRDEAAMIADDVFQSNPETLHDAADRIEALSAENERLREVLREVTPPPHFGESEQNKAWWAKARAALGEQQ